MKYLSCTETAKLIRQALKESFPGVKFSVKSSSYAGGASIGVRWTDGPSAAMVESVAKKFQGSYFDGMTDYKGSCYALVDGLMTSFGADYVTCSREHSDAAIERAIAQVQRQLGDVAEAATVEAYRSGSLYRVQVWNEDLQALIRRAAYRHSFTLAPRKSKTAGRVIYAGNDGYSTVAALSVE